MKRTSLFANVLSELRSLFVSLFANSESLMSDSGHYQEHHAQVHVRSRNVQFHALTMRSVLQNNQKFDDGCSKLSSTKFSEAFNGTIEIRVPFGAVDANESTTELSSHLC